MAKQTDQPEATPIPQTPERGIHIVHRSRQEEDPAGEVVGFQLYSKRNGGTFDAGYVRVVVPDATAAGKDDDVLDDEAYLLAKAEIDAKFAEAEGRVLFQARRFVPPLER